MFLLFPQKFLSGVMFEILAEYVITQPSVLRGVLLVLYNSMEIEQGIILAATLLLDGRDRSPPEKKRYHFALLDSSNGRPILGEFHPLSDSSSKRVYPSVRIRGAAG